jgi:predicted alpha/beta hydrolase family esterase
MFHIPNVSKNLVAINPSICRICTLLFTIREIKFVLTITGGIMDSSKNGRQILFIHSGGEQGPGQGSNDLVTWLQKELGEDYSIFYPMMPDPEEPVYSKWKLKLQEELSRVNDGVVLIGHSLGGSVLLKFLSEEPFKTKIAALCLVAAPAWGRKNWKVQDFMLRENFEDALPEIQKIFIYHSHNDEVVPFNHLLYYIEKLPGAVVRRLASGGHLFLKGLSELAADIKTLDRVISNSNRREMDAEL